MKIKGTIRKDDLGPGVFVIEADDGSRYVLDSSDAKLRKEGQKVEVDGTVDEAAMGIGMTGDPTLRVKSWKPK